MDLVKTTTTRWNITAQISQYILRRKLAVYQQFENQGPEEGWWCWIIVLIMHQQIQLLCKEVEAYQLISTQFIIKGPTVVLQVIWRIKIIAINICHRIRRMWTKARTWIDECWIMLLVLRNNNYSILLYLYSIKEP